MKIEQGYIDQIRTAFGKMQSREDLLHVLNEAKPLVYGNKAVPFELKQLTWYTNPKLGRKRFTEFKIKKKSGAERSIHAPVKGLKALQKTLSFVLQCVYEPHSAAMGFVRDKSIVDNAKQHTGRTYVYNIDLKDFFSSIDQPRVWKCFQLQPFHLNDNESINNDYRLKNEILDIVDSLAPNASSKLIKDIRTPRIWSLPKYTVLGAAEALLRDDTISLKEFNHFKVELDAIHIDISEEKKDQPFKTQTTRQTLANILASICCTELEVERKDIGGKWVKVKRNVLPQGAPTSPVVSNIVCQRLDYLLSGVAKRFGLKYSRYADDMTFSSMHNVYQPESDFLKELHRIINEQGFNIKESKTRLQKDGYRKEVTGLLVNEKANVQKRYVKQLRMWLYYWEKYGYVTASGFFLQHYISDKYPGKSDNSEFGTVVAGKLNYLKMVKGNENKLYLKLKGRFDVLNAHNVAKCDSDSVPFQNIHSSSNSGEITFSFGAAQDSTIAKLRININPLNNVRGSVKLKRQIIFEKGENLPLEKFIENDDKGEKVIDLLKHKPKDVTSFLTYFRKGEGIKFLTHDFDKPNSVFEKDEVLSIAKKEYEDIRKLYLIPQALSYRVFWFGFQEDSKPFRFLGNVHQLNWHSKELSEWINYNPGKHPAAEDSPFRSSMIIPFRKSYEIKSPELEELIVKKLSEKAMYTTFDFGIQNERIINLDKANFYTDVDSLDRGLGYLFNSINQRKRNSNLLKIEFSRVSDLEGRKRIIKIVHIDSVCNKPLDKNELFKGDLLEAEKALFGICDWSIISKSPDDSVNMLNILFDISSAKAPKEKIDESLIEGFTHVLTFYS